MRSRLAAAAILASVVLGAGPAVAQDELDASDVDSSAYPTLEVIVSAPGGADATAFTVQEPDGPVSPVVENLATGQLDVVLAIDTSGSMAGSAMDSARAAAREFAAAVPAQVRISVIGFGPTPTVASPLTSDRSVVNAAIDGLRAAGETALHDAVVAAALQLDATSDARTTLVVLSDGGDTVSTAPLDLAATVAEERFDVVHAISLVSDEQDVAALDALVSVGGRVVEARDPVALSAVYADVADRIVNQYALRWETSLSEDADIVIAFDDGATTRTASRRVDIDESTIVVPPVDSAPAAAPVDESATDGTETAGSAPVEATLTTVTNPGGLGTWVLVIGVILVAGALFVAGLVLFGPRTRTRRLAREMRQRVPSGRELTGVGRRLVDAVESFLRRDPERHSGLALKLDRAGLDWTPSEFGAVLVAGVAVLALVGFALGGLVLMLLLPVGGVFLGFAIVENRGRKRSALFTEQLDGTLQLISGSLRSGFGIVQALGTVAEEAEWPTSEEFTRILGETRMGRDLDDALEASAARVDSDDYSWVVQAIQISREVGGNLAEVLDNISGTIRQRNTLRRQVQSLSAEGRLSAIILLALPFVMLVWMRVTNPDYIDLLFSRTAGQIAVVAGVVSIVIGGFWMRRIVQVRF